MSRTIPVPRINTNDDRVEVVSWHIRAGDWVEVGQDVVEVETSKAVVTVQAEDAGYVTPLTAARKVVRVGAPLYALSQSAAEAAASQAVPAKAASAGAVVAVASARAELPSGPPARFSAQAEKLLAARGLARERFAGRGLVTARSILGTAAVRRAPTAIKGIAVASRSPPSPAADVPSARTADISLGKLAEIASLTSGESGNINSLLTVYFDSAAIRKRLKQDNTMDGNIQPLILFELARLLKTYPHLTCYFRDDTIHFYDRVDLGVAFDLGKGLKVVTLRDADKLMPVDFFQQTLDIGMRYLENRLKPEELTGSTFTVTDLSGFDVLNFHPLINGDQAAILGIGGDSALPGHPMTLNMTFDHRLSNGREVASFLQELRQRLLTYAPAASSDRAVQAAGSTAALSSAVRACDRCGVELQTYYREFPRDACMIPYFREDGTLGATCHRCWSGWV